MTTICAIWNAVEWSSATEIPQESGHPSSSDLTGTDQHSSALNVKPAQSAIERAAALVRIRVVEMLVMKSETYS
jgi:hypothetical protein